MRSLALAIVTITLAGCLAPSAEDAPVEEASAAGAPATVPVELAYDGETGGYGCAWVLVAGQCYGMSGENTAYEITADAPLASVAGEVTWTANSPSTSALGVELCVEDGEGWMCGEDSPYEYGESPLAFDFDLSDSNETRALVIWHWVGTPTPAGAGGSMPQPFSVAAMLTTATP
ncbi:MAG TPA: hypothetical protein VI997_09535 [Candidatus Thermoplasmatota archaeon]|nr:hypothetical protein [Candidatus Thermoplasmatota archaeon]